MNEQYVVLYSAHSGTPQVFGPFATEAEAREWALKDADLKARDWEGEKVVKVEDLQGRLHVYETGWWDILPMEEAR